MKPMPCHFISYPKSGRSWLRFALSSLGHGNKILFHHDGFEFNDGNLPAHNFDQELRRVKYVQPCRLVYLTRDPRDILVSLYHQVTGRFRDFFNYQGDISVFIRDDYFGAVNLQRFQQMWELLCDEGLAMRISYEECHEDFEEVLVRVLDHYQLESHENDICSATEVSSFKNMKQVELSGGFPEPWLRLRNEAPKVRQGKVGSYRYSLTDVDIVFLDSVFGKYREIRHGRL